MEQIELNGEDVLLPSKAAQVLSMVLHELATNAARYGALAEPHGRLAVSWELQGPASQRRLTLRWAELDGPAVTEPDGSGFGSRLIEQGVAYELSGEARLEYRPEGLRCTIEIPLAARAAARADEGGRLAGPGPAVA